MLTIVYYFRKFFFFSDTKINKMADQQKHTSHNHQEGEKEESHASNAHQICFLPKSPITENSDCLERIFMHLDIKTLLNVAHANKFFQTSAAAIFKRKFGTKSILLCCFNNCRRIDHHDETNRICNRGSKIIFPFLRVFGAEISKLEVHFYSHLDYSLLRRQKRSIIDSMMWRMNDYINMYCADTLSSLKLYSKPKLSNDFAKPFKQVEQLFMRWTYLNEQLLNFVECFPNLQQLDLLADSMDQQFSKVLLPQLKHLIVSFTSLYYDDANVVRMKNVGEFLKANPQLQSVVVCKGHAMDEQATHLFNLISGNPQLTKVELNVLRAGLGGGTNVEEAEVNRFVNEHPQLVELAIYEEYEFKAAAAIAVIHQLNSLKKFRFNIQNTSERNKFINQLGSDWIYTSKSNDNYNNSMNLHRT